MLFNFEEDIKIFIKPGRTDLRKAINGLSAIVKSEMKLDPLSGYLFLFCNKDRHLLKCLFWDKNGFVLWQKRLEKDNFPWPKIEKVKRELSHEELQWLLEGIDFFHKHEEVLYSSAI